METEKLHALFMEHPRVSTDSRNIPEGGIFFALKGPRFNGNHYAVEALEKGAAFAVVDEAEAVSGPKTLLVKDALKSLQDLGRFHRHYCSARVIGLTGSNGKTTTKELIAGVLQTRYRTLATSGNLNNHIGVPLTLLRIRPETEFAVIEMGANHQGEIAFLSGIAEPDFGYITNFGKAHLEGFGGVEGVIKGKSELYQNIMARGKMVFLNGDDPIQREKLDAYPHKVGFSTSDSYYYPIADLGADPCVTLEMEGVTIRTQLNGAYNFANCAVAALIGKYFNVPLPLIREALEAYRAENNRSQLLEKNGLEIILDAYNANPSSMKAALESFAKRDAGRKIAILGDMFELGEAAMEEHTALGTAALSSGFETVYLVGKHFEATDLPAKRFADYESLRKHLVAHPVEGPASILIKGSRGMALERILEVWDKKE